jgi:hypothetical protein
MDRKSLTVDLKEVSRLLTLVDALSVLLVDDHSVMVQSSITDMREIFQCRHGK